MHMILPGRGALLVALLVSALLPPGASTLAAPAGQGVLFRDDFADPESGWPRSSPDPAVSRVGYEAGEYVIARLQRGTTGVIRPQQWYDAQFRDFQVEIDARLVPPPDDGLVFLEFRRQRNGDGYVLVVDPSDGRFLLVRDVGMDTALLVDWTPARAIHRGAELNRLGVRVNGPSLVVLVNGQEVGRVRDETFPEGTVGFGVANLGSEPVEARFASLVVTSVN
jgi:hypothetical protein